MERERELERVCEYACVFRLTDFDSKGKGLRVTLYNKFPDLLTLFNINKQ